MTSTPVQECEFRARNGRCKGLEYDNFCSYCLPPTPKPTTFTHHGLLYDGYVFQNATRDEINAWLTAHSEWGVIKECGPRPWVYVALNADKGRGS